MKNISKKLLEFQKRITAIKKDGKNPHFKSSYATLPNILSEVKPILSELGLVVNQPILNNSVCTQITDPESGESVSGEIQLPTNLNPQQLGSAITYYRRYLLAGMLALEIEDDDGNEATKAKPLMNEAQFNKFITRLRSGEPDVYENAERAFSFTKEQLEHINKIV